MSEPWAHGEGIRNCGRGETSLCLCLPHPYSLLPLFKPSSPHRCRECQQPHSSLLLPPLPDTVLGFPPSPVCPSLISSSHQDHTGLIWLPFPNTQFLLQTESPSAPLSHSGGHCLQHGSHSWWDPSPHCPWPKSARAHCGWSHLLPTPSSFSNCMTGTFPLAFQSRDLSIYMKLTLLSVY